VTTILRTRSDTHFPYTTLFRSIGTRDEYDMIQRYQNIADEEISDSLFQYQSELVVIKHGVQGSKAYTKSGEYYEGKAFKAKVVRSEEHTSELQSRFDLVCRLLL